MFSETIIQCRGVGFRYPDGTQALTHIDLDVTAGEKLAVIGPNGAGKSTFLQLLNGGKRGTGRIHIAGLLLNDENLRQIKQRVGLVFQDPDDQLFCPTLYDDVAFGPRNFAVAEETIPQCVEESLAAVGLSGYAHRSSLNLSYGERKLASLAAVIALQPPIIALDEPTSNLDALHRRKIIRWLQNCRATCLITSHDLDMILETCDTVAIFNGGRLAAHGPAADILHDKILLEHHNLELPLTLQARQDSASSNGHDLPQKQLSAKNHEKEI